MGLRMPIEPLDTILGLRVSATAKSRLAHLSLGLKDRGLVVGQGEILDHLVRKADPDALESAFRKVGDSE
jgi:hypothetical protein